MILTGLYIIIFIIIASLSIYINIYTNDQSKTDTKTLPKKTETPINFNTIITTPAPTTIPTTISATTIATTTATTLAPIQTTPTPSINNIITNITADFFSPNEIVDFSLRSTFYKILNIYFPYLKVSIDIFDYSNIFENNIFWKMIEMKLWILININDPKIDDYLMQYYIFKIFYYNKTNIINNDYIYYINSSTLIFYKYTYYGTNIQNTDLLNINKQCMAIDNADPALICYIYTTQQFAKINNIINASTDIKNQFEKYDIYNILNILVYQFIINSGTYTTITDIIKNNSIFFNNIMMQFYNINEMYKIYILLSIIPSDVYDNIYINSELLLLHNAISLSQ